MSGQFITTGVLEFKSKICIVTIVPIFVGTCDSESLVASGHKKIWRPPAAYMGFCDFKDVVAFGNNQLWRPRAAKVKDHHSGLPPKMVSIMNLSTPEGGEDSETGYRNIQRQGGVY